MSEIDIDGWSMELEGERSVMLTSREGEIVANRGEDEGSTQVWFVCAKLEGYESMSWKVNAQDKDDLINRSIPKIIEEGVPTHTNHKEN